MMLEVRHQISDFRLQIKKKEENYGNNKITKRNRAYERCL